MANFNANVVTTSPIVNQTNKRYSLTVEGSSIVNQTNKRYVSTLSSSNISNIPTRISLAPLRSSWVADAKKDTGTGGQFQSDEFPTMYFYLN